LKDFGPVPSPPYIRSAIDYSRGETSGTLEPRKETKLALEETGTENDPAAQMQVIRALAADLVGAFIDVRATRTMVEDIVEQPEVKVRFKAWHKGRRR
jgi:hypothetical protein